MCVIASGLGVYELTLQATRAASEVMPAVTYEALSLSRAAARQLGCMLLDDRTLLTLEIFQGMHHHPSGFK